MAKYICIIYCHYICFLFHYLPYKRQRLSDRHRFDNDPTLSCRVDVQSISFQWSLTYWMDGPLPSSYVFFCHSYTTIESIKTGCYHSNSCGTSVVVNSFISRAKNTTWLPLQLKHSRLNGWKIHWTLNWVIICLEHADVIKWKHFPRCWLFVWGNHRLPVNSPHNGQWRSFDVFFDLRLNINPPKLCKLDEGIMLIFVSGKIGYYFWLRVYYGFRLQLWWVYSRFRHYQVGHQV